MNDDVKKFGEMAKEKLEGALSEENREKARQLVSEAGERAKDTLDNTIGKENADKLKKITEATGERAKEKLGEAFSEEKREKAKELASEAIDNIKQIDVQKGKEKASASVSKLRKSKIGKLVVTVIVLVALLGGGWFVYQRQVQANIDEINSLAGAVISLEKATPKHTSLPNKTREVLLNNSTPQMASYFQDEMDRQDEIVDKLKEYAKHLKPEVAEKNKESMKGYCLGKKKPPVINGDEAYVEVTYIFAQNDPDKTYHGKIYFEKKVSA